MGAERVPLFVAAGAAIALFLAEPRQALAFCRTSSCPNVGTSMVCTPPRTGDCGLRIFWPSPCVTFNIQKDASSQVSLEVAQEVLQGAFNTWMSAACPGGGTPRINVSFTGPVECDKHEYNQKEGIGNANIIIFRDESWPHEGAGSTLALTTVTYNTETGEIYDADMEVNSANVALTTGDSGVKFDFRSIATHEAGHFLGLSHTPVASATMTTEYAQGSIDLRDLEEDDRAGICDAYPPGDPIPGTCDSTPRHGFSSTCGDETKPKIEGGCCSVAPGAADVSGRAAALFAAASAAALAMRKRRPRKTEA